MRTYELTLALAANGAPLAHLLTEVGYGDNTVQSEGEFRPGDRTETVRFQASDARAALQFVRQVRQSLKDRRPLRAALIGASGPFAKPVLEPRDAGLKRAG